MSIEKKNEINWLHISDVHFRAKDLWRDASARSSLISKLDECYGQGVIQRPDLIFCTGDIAFGSEGKQSIQSQYQDAEVFFKMLQEVAQIPRQRIFIVPGNHDVQRDKVNRMADDFYRKSAKEWWIHEEKINSEFSNAAKEYLDALERLGQYNNFVRNYFEHQYNESGAHYIKLIEIRGIHLQIIGLNSAWTCSGSEEERDIWVAAQAQLSSVNRDGSIRIALIHHPLEWVSKSDARVLENRMGKDIHFLLHGHEHEFREHYFGDGFPVIGTGAVSASNQLEHGVLSCKLNLDQNTLDRTLLIYNTLQADWIRSLVCEKSLKMPEFRPRSALANDRRDKKRKYIEFFSRPGRHGFDEDIDDYDQFVEPGANIHNRDVVYFSNLWSDSMGPHTVQKLAGDSAALHFDGTASSTRVIQKDNLDAYFLRRVMITPTISATASDDNQDINDAMTSFDAFVKEVSESPRGKSQAENTDSSENKVRYFVGDAGIGKTLAVLKLVDAIRVRHTDDFGYKIVPVYIDLHQDRNWAQMDPAKAVNKVVERVIQELGAAVADQIPNLMPIDYVDENSSVLDSILSSAALILFENKISPLVILDNGDKFFFENARFRFFEIFARRRDWHLDDTFVSLVDRFVNEKALGKIGASVLVVCRRYVYAHCLRISDSADPSGPVRRAHKPYQLLPADHSEVLGSRIRLMKDATDSLVGKYRNAEMFSERIRQLENRLEYLRKEQFHRNRSVLGTVWDLGHQGHRSWLSFLASLPIDVGPNAEIADRLFGSSYLLLRLYITNLRKKYSQAQGHFPNLFLVDAYVLPNGVFKESRQPHVHTYWLKYLLLSWARKQKHGRHKGSVSSEAMIRQFVDEFRYEENLVRLAVGSLADPSTSNCFSVAQPDRIERHIELLKVSPRGDILVNPGARDAPLCFTFDYLQLVTDDYLLALPKCIANEIYVDADLGHSLKSGSVYATGARETLKKKIPAVVYFYRVLELTFDFEVNYRGIREKVFELGLAPNFSDLREKLFDSIARLDRHFTESDERVPMPNPREVWKKVVDNERLLRDLEVYYSDPPPVAI